MAATLVILLADTLAFVISLMKLVICFKNYWGKLGKQPNIKKNVRVLLFNKQTKKNADVGHHMV